MIRKSILTVFLLISASTAQADCVYNGVIYPEGTIIGPYICIGTQWVIR